MEYREAQSYRIQERLNTLAQSPAEMRAVWHEACEMFLSETEYREDVNPLDCLENTLDMLTKQGYEPEQVNRKVYRLYKS